jgi:hypothetical protein
MEVLERKATPFNSVLAEDVINRIASGDPLWQICSEPGMPSRRVVLEWVRTVSSFGADYARARIAAVDAVYDDIDRISRDGGRDVIVEDIDGLRVERTDHEHINRSKLIVDTLKWRAAHLRPDIFGDRLSHNLDDKGNRLSGANRLEITVSMREPTETSG